MSLHIRLVHQLPQGDIPFRVKNVEQLLCVHFLGGCEHHNLIQLCNTLQKFKQEGPLPDCHSMFSGIELDGELEVCWIVPIQRGVHLQ